MNDHPNEPTVNRLAIYAMQLQGWLDRLSVIRTRNDLVALDRLLFIRDQSGFQHPVAPRTADKPIKNPLRRNP
jgi:hypothetical protein